MDDEITGLDDGGSDVTDTGDGAGYMSSTDPLDMNYSGNDGSAILADEGISSGSTESQDIPTISADPGLKTLPDGTDVTDNSTGSGLGSLFNSATGLFSGLADLMMGSAQLAGLNQTPLQKSSLLAGLGLQDPTTGDLTPTGKVVAIAAVAAIAFYALKK